MPSLYQSLVYDGEPLPKPPDSVESCKNEEDFTAFVLHHISVKGKDLAKQRLKENPILRYISLHDKAGGFGALRLEKSHEQEAIVAHVTMSKSKVSKDKKSRCKQCASHKCRGPFADCIGNDSDVFDGACACCKYSGTPKNCGFAIDLVNFRADLARKDEIASMNDRGALVDFTADDLKNHTTADLERLASILDNVISSRQVSNAGSSKYLTPQNKRRRT